MRKSTGAREVTIISADRVVDGGVGNISSPVVQAEVESPLDAVDFGFRP